MQQNQLKFTQRCCGRVFECFVCCSKPTMEVTRLTIAAIVLASCLSLTSSKKSCELIKTELCSDIGYNRTIFPNLLRHRTQEEAHLEISQFSPLIQLKCSQDFAFFLCVVYVPICTQLQTPLPPCRSLCKSAKQGCEQVMQQFGYTWPNQLECDNFPKDKDEPLCVGQNVSERRYNPDTPDVGAQNKTRDNLDNIDITYMPFTCPKEQEVDSDQYEFFGKKRCAAECNNIYFDKREKQITRIWVGIWAILCALSTLFTILTFLIDMDRFRYPERPIIFLSGCYFMVSLAYIVGFGAGDIIACNEADGPGKVSTLVQGTKNPDCTVVFMILYFFSMASSIWWVILTLTWFLAAGLKWGHEAIEANSHFFHFAAWAIPAVKTIAILVMTKVDGDELSGVCFVGLSNLSALRGYVLAPLLIYFAVGLTFLLAGFISLFRVRSILKDDYSKREKIEKLMIRIGVFSILYTVPALTVIGCLIYEQANRETWDKYWLLAWKEIEKCVEVQQQIDKDTYCPAKPLARQRPDFTVFMVKYVSFLIVGITSGFWIWSNKTIKAWKRFYGMVTRSHNQANTTV